MKNKSIKLGADVYYQVRDSQYWTVQVRVSELRDDEKNPGQWEYAHGTGADCVTYQISGTYTNLEEKPETLGLYSFAEWEMDFGSCPVELYKVQEGLRLANKIQKRHWKLDEERGRQTTCALRLLRAVEAMNPVAVRFQHECKDHQNAMLRWREWKGCRASSFETFEFSLFQDLEKRFPHVFAKTEEVTS